MIVSQNSATYRLGNFLDGLLRPVLQRHAEPTAFVDGADFMRQFNHYAFEEHRLRPRTAFTTIEISNFYTMVNHETILITLKQFLSDHLSIPGIDDISIPQIVKLTTLFLNNNRFYYNQKIYSFTKGGPCSSLLTDTLLNIYAFEWQKSLLKKDFRDGGIYGR